MFTMHNKILLLALTLLSNNLIFAEKLPYHLSQERLRGTKIAHTAEASTGLKQEHLPAQWKISIPSYFQAIKNDNERYPEELITTAGNRYMRLVRFPEKNTPFFSLTTLNATVNEAMRLLAKKSKESFKWLNHQKPIPEEDPNNHHITKLIFPVRTKLIFFGDLHGSIHSLVRTIHELQKLNYLDENLMIKPGIHLIFLGDMVDYGNYGIDTLFTALQLFIRNPDQVTLCRGNHEDFGQYNANTMWTTRPTNKFFQEVAMRYSDEIINPAQFPGTRQGIEEWDQAVTAHSLKRETFKNDVSTLFTQLPLATFIGIKGNFPGGWVQACHGGLVASAGALLNGFFRSPATFAKLEPTMYENLAHNQSQCNFNWGDISGLFSATTADHSIKYGRTHGKQEEHCQAHFLDEAEAIMEEANIIALVRGHQDQHNCFKITFPELHNPIYPFMKRTAFHEKCLSALEWKSFNALALQEKFKTTFPSPDALFSKGFFIKDLLKISPIAVITNSLARSSKVWYDEGCSIITIGTDWKQSKVQALVKERRDEPRVFNVYQQAYK